MEPAFLQFTEPYAWLIRGLVEYGWEDLSLKPQNLPKRYAFNLRPFIETNGKKGVFYIVWHLTLMEDGSNKINPILLF